MRPPMPLRWTHMQKPPRRTREPKPPRQMCAPKLPRQTPTVLPRQTRTPRYPEFLLKYSCNQYSRRIPVHVARDFFQFFTEVS